MKQTRDELLYCQQQMKTLSRHNVNGYSFMRGCSHSVLNSINTNYLPPLPVDGLYPPAYSISLDYVFGFEQEGRRNLVAYAGE